MNRTQFLQLIDKYLAGQTTADEEQLLVQFFDSFQHTGTWDERVLGVKQELETRMLNRLLRSVQQNHQSKPVRIRPLHNNWRSLAAAVALLLLAGGAYLIQSRNQTPMNQVTNAQSTTQPTLIPGGNNAVLRLADGSTIRLNQAANGTVAVQGRTTVTKTADGQLRYMADQRDPAATHSLNTISTPRGGQYQLTLPDGTIVWLNAESSLRFPVAFETDERRVELTGEAYFEVAKRMRDNTHDRLPFIVQTVSSRVEVLGTHFNVMAYPNAPAQETTLLEGSVRVRRGAQTQLITPGQQAQSPYDNRAAIQVKTVDTERIMAWKEGLFLFDDTPLNEAMQQVARWYDAEITYEGPAPTVSFTGVLPRSSSLPQLLNLLESTRNVQFTVRGNRIIVRQK